MGNPWEKDAVVGQDDADAAPWDKDERVGGDATAGDYARGFAGGFNKGLTSIIGVPVDITNSVLSMVGLDVPEPVGGGKWLHRKISKVGDFYPGAPDTALGRGVERVGEEIGASSVPALGIFKAARGVAPAASAVERGLVQGVFLDPIRRAPGSAGVGELAAATGAGVGAAVAQEVAPGNKAAETTGQIIGGVAPSVLTVTPTALAVRAARWFSSRFSTKAQKDMARIAVERTMGENLTGDAVANLETGIKLSDEMPGFRPSIAESTGNPALTRQQARVESEAEGSFLNFANQRRAENLKAIEAYSSAKAPVGDVAPEIVIDAANNRLHAVGETVDRMAAKNVQKQRDLADGIRTIDKIESGQTIRDAINSARADASAKMSIRAEELGLNDVDLSVPFQEWRKGIIKKYKQTSRFEDEKNIPSILSDIKKDGVADAQKRQAGFTSDLSTPQPRESETTFSDIKAIRERINDELITALSPVKKDRKKIRILTRMKKDVDELLSSLDPYLGENYKTFRKEYFDNFVKPFESGAIFKSRSKDGTGFYKTTDENVAGLFIDNQSAAKQYREIFGEDQQMMAAMENAVLDDLKNNALTDGMIDPKKLSRWKHKHRDALGELPSIKKSVDDIDATQTALLDRQNQLSNRRKAVENNALSKMLTQVQKGNATAGKVIDDAVGNHVKMRALVNLVKQDDAALAALKRTVWEGIIKGDSASILTALDKNKASLGLLFGRDHLKNIERVSMAKAMMERIPPPVGKAYTPKPFEKFENITGMQVPQATTRYWAFMSGRVPKYYLAFDIAKSALYKKSQRHFDMVLREALYDPMVAKEMAESIMVGKLNLKRAKRLGARIFALGVPYIEDEQEN